MYDLFQCSISFVSSVLFSLHQLSSAWTIIAIIKQKAKTKLSQIDGKKDNNENNLIIRNTLFYSFFVFLMPFDSVFVEFPMVKHVFFLAKSSLLLFVFFIALFMDRYVLFNFFQWTMRLCIQCSLVIPIESQIDLDISYCNPEELFSLFFFK